MSGENQIVKQSETGLVPSNIDLGLGGELQSAGTAAIIQETQAAVVLAKKFPRDLDSIHVKVMKACSRKSLADVANYSFPRGGKQVSGPSVNLARVLAQLYGNVRWGLDIIRDDEESIHIRGWAWDIENNTKVTADDRFKKLVYRKANGGTWVKPDERDLRELVNRRGAIALRNCLLQIMPKDLVEDAQGRCRETLAGNIKDIAVTKKQYLEAFDKIGVTVEMLNKYLDGRQWTKEVIIEFHEILTSINDGQSKVDDYFSTKPEQKEPTIDPSKMSVGDPTKHQGYNDAPKANPKDIDKSADVDENNEQGQMEF